jgi:hypothetical protein
LFAVVYRTIVRKYIKVIGLLASIAYPPGIHGTRLFINHLSKAGLSHLFLSGCNHLELEAK